MMIADYPVINQNQFLAQNFWVFIHFGSYVAIHANNGSNVLFTNSILNIP